MKKYYFILLLCSTFTFGQTVFNQGEVMLTGYYLDGEDPETNCNEGFAFVSFVDILDTTEIRFSEEDYNQWGSGAEGDLVWTNNTGVTIPALTSVLITTHDQGGLCGGPSASLGSVAFEGAGTWALSVSTEEIIVFQGTAARTLGTPISMLQTNSSFPVPGMNSAHIIDFSSVAANNDIGAYMGPITFADFADFVAQLTDVNNNWITQDTADDNGSDGPAPEHPDDLYGGFANSLGINSVAEESSFKLYPNPVIGNTVHIVSKTGMSKSVQVYDLFGKLVLNEETRKDVNVSGLSSGVYVVKINEGSTSVSKKLIIK